MLHTDHTRFPAESVYVRDSPRRLTQAFYIFLGLSAAALLLFVLLRRAGAAAKGTALPA